MLANSAPNRYICADMEIKLITVGKTDVKWVKEGLDLYGSRLRHYVSFTVTEIPELKKVSALTQAQIKEKEGELILRLVGPQDILVLLDEHGHEYRSLEFADHLSRMTFSHQMVRTIFAEQLYRAFTILKGEPYHHE